MAAVAEATIGELGAEQDQDQEEGVGGLGEGEAAAGAIIASIRSSHSGRSPADTRTPGTATATFHRKAGAAQQ